MAMKLPVTPDDGGGRAGTYPDDGGKGGTPTTPVSSSPTPSSGKPTLTKASPLKPSTVVTPATTEPRSGVRPATGTGNGGGSAIDTSGDIKTPALPDQRIIPGPVPPFVETPHRTFTFVPSREPLPVIYGPARVGGQIFHTRTQWDGSVVVAWAICYAAPDGISDIPVGSIEVDGKAILSYGLGVGASLNIYLGTSTQTVDPLLQTSQSTWTNALPNVAYIVARFPKPSATQPMPDIEKFVCVVNGNKVRDPRLGVDGNGIPNQPRVYSTNWALIIADFMTSTVFGGGALDSQIPWTGTLTTTANDCDVLLADGTPRFWGGIVLNEKRESEEWVEKMRTAAQILAPVYDGGVYQIVMDKAQAPSAVALTDQGPAANIVAAGPLIVTSIVESPTRVIVNFSNYNASYKDDRVIDDDPGIALGTVEVYEKEFHIGTATPDVASRIARYLRKRGALDKRLPVTLLDDGGMQLLPGASPLVTSIDANWSNQQTIVSTIKKPGNSLLWTAMLELYSASLYDDTQVTVTTSAPPANPSPYDTPPDVVNLTVTGSTGDNAAVYWDPPATLVESQYGSSYWSQSGAGNYDGTKVNDGNTTNKAFDSNVAADTTIAIDFGAGISRDLRYFIDITDNASPFSVIEYSDNGSAWTAVSNPRRCQAYNVSGTPILTGELWPQPPTPISGLSVNKTGWSPAGAHRYWRARKNSSLPLARNTYEVQWGEATAISPFITGYRCFDAMTGHLFAEIDAHAIPTVTNKLALKPIATTSTAAATNITTSTATVTVVAYARGRSSGSGITGTPATFTFFAPGTLGLPLSNGLNSDIDISAFAVSGNFHSMATINGPTLAFSIGGFSPTYGAKSLTLKNGTTQQMTIVNEDAGSTAGNRIQTFTGTNITLAASNGVARFEYDTITARWLLVSCRDSAGSH